MRIFITGAAGFIGSRLAEVLAEEGTEIIGLDHLNDYYDPRLKLQRLERCGFDVVANAHCRERVRISPENDYLDISSLPFGVVIKSGKFDNFHFIRRDIADDRVNAILADFKPDIIVHLAAQPGVRYSIENPAECIESNISDFLKVLEYCRNHNVKRLLYASSSSVYGNQPEHPFRETDNVDNPLSVYAVTKRTNELLAKVYSEMYDIHTIGMRFFSVYGEWGRPDMAPMLFAKAILENDIIRLFNAGRLSRDFTYIDDVIESIRRIIHLGSGFPTPHPLHEVINIGHGSPTMMIDFVRLLEDSLGKKGKIRIMPMQRGEALATMADVTKLRMRYGYQPSTELAPGLQRFARWAKDYFYNQNPDISSQSFNSDSSNAS